LSIEPGQHEKRELIKYACFDLLVRHVEDELSQYYDVGHKFGDHPKESKSILGLQFLELQIKKLNKYRVGAGNRTYSLSVEEQCAIKQLVNYEKIYELYKWWIENHSARGDIFTHSGFRQYYNDLLSKHGARKLATILENETSAEVAHLEKLSDDANYIKEQWEREDENRLAELILLRPQLVEPK
jgi:hypothetical protein